MAFKRDSSNYVGDISAESHVLSEQMVVSSEILELKKSTMRSSEKGSQMVFKELKFNRYLDESK